MLNLQNKFRALKKAKLNHFSSSKSINFPSSFTLLSQKVSDDISATINILKHQKSGAIIYNLKNSDPDNCFAPIVKTLPKNNTGCPHILEHLACCGSERYPIRDPFFNMLKRSTNTYMNAWTGDDFTSYPFSSANPQDFQNLYKVYLDLCLKPNLHQLDFRQEGWRYEYSTNQNGQQIKQLKGIVFNEMKGAYQNADRQMYVEINKKLFAGIPYQYDSGGKPEQIIRLSYQDILDMHKYYYHPSNSSFFFYGNADISSRLQYLESQYLNKYSNEEKKYQLNIDQPKIHENIFHEVVSPNAQSVSVALAYNMGPLKQMTSIENFCFQIISYLMCEANPILYEQYIEKGLAHSLGGSGFQSSTFCTFKVHLKNVQSQNDSKQISRRIYEIFEQILHKICKGGQGCYKIDENRLKQILVQSELNLLVPKQTNGIETLGNCIPFMNNRLELNNLINVRINIKKAVQIIKDPVTRTQFITKFFINNPRKVVLKQVPKNIQKQNSQNKFVGLDMPENTIRQQQSKLKTRQEHKDLNDTDCLPSLKLQDLITTEQFDYSTTNYSINGNESDSRMIHIKIDKKNLNFYRFTFRLPIQDTDQNIIKIIGILDLWKYLITKGMGISTKNLTNKQISQKLKRCVYDFDVLLQKDDSIDREKQGVQVTFKGACLADTSSQFLDLMRQILHENVFKKEDCLNAFKGYITDSTDQLINMPMKQCIQLCSGLITGNLNCNAYNWISNGIKTAQLQDIPSQLLTIFPTFISKSQLIITQHSQIPTLGIYEKLGFTSSPSSRSFKKPQKLRSLKPSSKSSIAITHNYDVNFCTQQYPAPAYKSAQHAHLTLFLEMLEQDYLHPKIRQQGGAYGARATIRQTGSIALYSYMDPYAENTFKAFDNSIKELIQDKISKQKLQQLKIKVLGGIDKPIPPQNQCVNMIMMGQTIEKRKKYRQQIERASVEQIISVGEKYLLKNDSYKKRVIFGKEVPNGFENEKLCVPKQ